MFENPKRGRQARNFTTNAPKILDLKSSSEQIFSRKLPLGAPDMTSFSYHKTPKKIPNIIFGETFHSSWQDDLSFLSGQGAGRVLCPEVQPLTLLYSIFRQKSYLPLANGTTFTCPV